LEISKLPREQEAAALRKWFLSQKRFGSWAAMERALALNTSEGYLVKIKNGKKRAIQPELRAKLHDATGLDVFKPVSGKLPSVQTQTRLDFPQRTQPKEPQSALPKKSEDTNYLRARRIKKLLVALADELEFFKQDSELTRETFRKVVPGEDVGYITTLLRALYNEDQFQRWLLFSKYEMKSAEED
jgi:hypothetical protein